MIIRTNRAKPRVQILRGWDLVSTSTLHQVHPVKAGEDIRSGMVISRVWNPTAATYEWVRGCTSARAPYIAFQDSTEADVVAANGLTGISISGDYEIQTGYFSAGTYTADTLLTFDGLTGNVRPVTGAPAGQPILGRVTRNNAPKQLNPSSNRATFYENSETTPANSNVITFETQSGGLTA
jgi:hypothetical protein